MEMIEIEDETEAAAAAFAALGAPTRLAIPRCLLRAGPEGLPVAAVQERLGLAASTLSHHLRAMVAAGIMEQRRAGRSLICRALCPDRGSRAVSADGMLCLSGRAGPSRSADGGRLTAQTSISLVVESESSG